MHAYVDRKLMYSKFCVALDPGKLQSAPASVSYTDDTLARVSFICGVILTPSSERLWAAAIFESRLTH